MRKVTNEKLIKRNEKIGNYATIIGFILLAASVYVGFKFVNLLGIAVILTLIGFIVSQIGMQMGVRYGGRPRLDETLNKALKGLPNSNTLYHYSSPVSHLLVGPSGIWSINPRNIRGNVTYNERRNRYRHVGGGFWTNYLKLFGQGLGRPELELRGDIKSLQKFFSKQFPDEEQFTISSILVFTDPATIVNADSAPFPTLALAELKNYFRKESKNRNLSDEQIERINSLLQEE